jgi:hypothetical protein
MLKPYLRALGLLLSSLRIGAHTSIAKSHENAALTAARIGGNTFQIFSASPRIYALRLSNRLVKSLSDVAKLRPSERRFRSLLPVCALFSGSEP